MPDTNICQYWPQWFREILDFQALCQTEGDELRAMAEFMSRVRENLFVQTMDEGTAALWEEILHILPEPDDSLEFRRKRILNRIALRPPFTLHFLRDKLDALFGPGNYELDVDYPNYTLYIESSVRNQKYFTEVSALLHIVKPCHIVYISRPRIDAGLVLGERVSRVQTQYNYIQGVWALGEKPFASSLELEVLKMETQPSVKQTLLEQTAAFVAGDVAAARINSSILITELIRTQIGNIGSVSYPVRRSQTEEVTLAELLDKDGSVLSASGVAAPVLEDTIFLRHSFIVKEDAPNGEQAH